VGVILQSGSLDLYSIVEQQAGILGLSGWNILWVQPIGFFVYMVAAIAETNRVPFDLPEAETELVAGFHTEYSAMKFALFFLAEYVNMFRQCWPRRFSSVAGMVRSSISYRGSVFFTSSAK
jgi:NADH-quinone oxidoreductase subunit H